MPTDDVPSRKRDQKCEKCGGVTELLTLLPRLGERPAYRIFGCSACNELTWIAEAIGRWGRLSRPPVSDFLDSSPEARQYPRRDVVALLWARWEISRRCNRPERVGRRAGAI